MHKYTKLCQEVLADLGVGDLGFLGFQVVWGMKIVWDPSVLGGGSKSRKDLGMVRVIDGSKGEGVPGTRPHLWVQILSFSCSFQEIFDQILGWQPHLWGWRHLLWKILDPPLRVPKW